MQYPYQVLLLKPKLLSKDYGREVVYLHVKEDSPDEAIVAAQQLAHEKDEHPECDPGDWHALLVIEGYEENRAPPPEADRWFTTDREEATYLSLLLKEVARDAPSAAKSAIALRVLKKLANVLGSEKMPKILVTGVEHRVMDLILYDKMSDRLDSRAAEMVERLSSALMLMPPVIKSGDLD